MNKDDMFESERLLYRGISEEDSDCLVKWRSDPDLIRFFRNPEPVTLQSHLEWFRNSYMPNDSRYDFIIIEKASKQRIGTVSVNNIDYEKSICQTSHMIAEFDFWGKGFSGEALFALRKRINKEGIRNVYCEIHQDNLGSIHINEKLGYVRSSQRGDFIILRRDEE